jgi:hypothetical protein
MVASLLLLALLSTGLAYLWHKRIAGFKAFRSTMNSRFGENKIDRKHERGFAHCISQQWVLEYIARGKESRIGNSIRNFINDQTVIGFFIMGVLILPTTATFVVLFYRSFAFLGTSIVVLIVAIFLIRASDNVKASYGLMAWLRTQDDSELKENDVVFVEESLKILTNWRMKLVVIALLSLVVAPWGELIPQAIALATSGFLITIFSLVYPPVAIISHRVAVIVILYLIPLGIALLYLLYGSTHRVLAYLNGELLRNL